MGDSDVERIAMLEKGVENLERRTGTLETKIDKFIDKWDARFVGLLVTMAGLLAVAVMNLIIMLGQKGG